MSLPIVICLTPVRNEAWILKQFLESASLWADHIIIADQNSNDGSREIACQFPKVILLGNTDPLYDEQRRQKILLDAAREFPGPRLIIALDADEFLTPNFSTSSEWQAILNAHQGATIWFPWANIKPNMKHYWLLPKMPLGYMDDGSDHSGSTIHSPRIPLPLNVTEIILQEIYVMHYQYTDWERMRSKHRWYQCWERINNPQQSAINIFRRYHHMFAIKKSDLRTIPEWWFDRYKKNGIDIRTVHTDKSYRWDKEILQAIEEHGAGFFAKEAMWDINWEEIANQYGYENTSQFRDPRSLVEKIVHALLLKTQPYSENIWIRLAQKMLKRYFAW
jgi:hypothetical protein